MICYEQHLYRQKQLQTKKKYRILRSEESIILWISTTKQLNHWNLKNEKEDIRTAIYHHERQPTQPYGK